MTLVRITTAQFARGLVGSIYALEDGTLRFKPLGMNRTLSMDRPYSISNADDLTVDQVLETEAAQRAAYGALYDDVEGAAPRITRV